MPKIENTSANVQEMLKKDGTVDQISKKLENILNGSIIVKKAEQDANGSNIVNTYATKDEFDIAFLNKGIYPISIQDNGSVIFLDNSDLDNLSSTGLYKLLNPTQKTTAWLFVVECPTGGTKTRAQFLIDTDGFIYYRSYDMGEWRNWKPYATQEDLNRKTEAFETIELKTTNISSLTVSSELTNLIDEKIYKINCGYFSGWLFVTQRGLQKKNAIQTIIDFDGNIYHRYRYITDITSEEGWSDWILIPDDEYLQELLVASFDERGIRQPYPIPSYDELTEHGVYSLDKGIIDNEYVFSVHSPVSLAEITQYRLNSEEGLLKRTYSQNMETGERSWSDWSKYISTENIDTTLSDTSTNPVQNKVIKQAIDLKAEQLELERLKYYGDKDIIPSDESYFTVNETGETITGLTDSGKTQTELVIPYKINGKEITTLWGSDFSSILAGNSVITKVVIPSSVTSIGEYAFSGCSSLTSINIPDSVTTIGRGVFGGCSALTSINIPNSVTDIATDAFSGCSSLTSITISNSVTTIDANVFANCTSLTSINIPNSVTTIVYQAFSYCSALTSINIPNSVTSIDNFVFSGCTDLTIYCEQGSYAETYAKENNIPVKYTDIDASKYIAKDIADSTYATKTELRPTPITSTATAITANNSYNYGEQTELSIAFPTTANDGDVVYITFTSGATATVLTIDTTNTSDIELIPEANTGYEVYAKYNGTIWIVNYSDYTVTAEAGA